MSGIIILEKPESISWEEIRTIIQSAYKNTDDNIPTPKVATLPADKLEERIKGKGKCFIAMKGDSVIATMAYRIKKANKWYMPGGEGIDLTMVAVLPQYRGQGLFSKLYDALEADIKDQKVKTLVLDTPEKNEHAQNIYLSKGFVYVDYFWARQGHYSVEMAKYMDSCPFSKTYCKIRFTLQKIIVRGKVKIKKRLHHKQ